MLKAVTVFATIPLSIPVVVGFAMPAEADSGFVDVICGEQPRPGCQAEAETSGRRGDDDSAQRQSPGDGKCRNPQGLEIACEREGGWAGSDGCYYKATDPSPETVAALGGQPAGAGGWYQRMCYSTPTYAETCSPPEACLTAVGSAEVAFGGPVWVAGAPPVVSPEVLARRAVARLTLPDVVIRVSPPGDQLVGLPTWLAVDSASWSAQSATASVPGVSVTAVARPVRATWSTGDGATEVCLGPGTPWRPGMDPAAASPDCGHVYTRSSAGAPGGVVTVTVAVVWEVSWAGAGRSGTVPGLTTTGSLQLRVAESQTVLTR